MENFFAPQTAKSNIRGINDLHNCRFCQEDELDLTGMQTQFWFCGEQKAVKWRL